VSMKRMTNVLQNVCPGALVCRGEQTSAASSADLDYDFISCCNGTYTNNYIIKFLPFSFSVKYL
jgi:hypothetical protein